MTGPAREHASDPPAGGPHAGLLWDALPVLLLVLAACLLFWQAVLLRGVFFYYDHAIQNYPFRLFFARGLAAGHLPLWTSDLFCGFPLFAEGQANALYPPFLLLFGLLPPWVAYNYYTVLHFALAGVSTYALARALDVGRAGAFVAGLCYMLTGPLLYHAHHTNIVVGVALLPLLLFLMEMGLRRGTLPWLLGFAAVTGALVLGAQPQYTIYDALVCGIYLVWRLRLVQVSGEGGRRALVLAAGFGAAAVLGGLLAAAQALPTLELVGHTSRAGLSAPGASPGVPGNLLTLLLPHAFGSPGLGSYWGSIDPGLYSELTLFVGVGTLMLAFVGAWADRSRRALFFLGLGLFAFIFALGFHGSLYNAIGQLPILRATRFPSRFAYVMALSAALLAGMGLEKLLRAGEDARVRRGAALAVLGAAALSVVCVLVVAINERGFFGLSFARLRAALPFLPSSELEGVWRYLHSALPADVARLGGVLLLACGLMLVCTRRLVRWPIAAAGWAVLVFVELASAGSEFTAVTAPSIYLDTPPLVATLRALPPGRILTYRYYDMTYEYAEPAVYPFTQGWRLDPAPYAASLDRIPPNANLIWDIPSAGGFSPLQTLALKTLLGRAKEQSTMIEFDLTRPLDLLGVRYILTPRDQIPGNYCPLTTVGGINIFENPNALPRAFTVHRAEAAPLGDGAAVMLAGPGFDYAERLLVHDAAAPLLTDAPGRAESDETAQVTQDDGDAVTVRARLDRPGYLVLADQWYPGWQVEVDGSAAPLLRVDYLLKGVQIGPGEHAVRFLFRPASFRTGVTVSLAALAVLAGGVIVCLVRARAARQRLAPPEAQAPWAAPARGHTVRLVLIAAAVFLAISPLLRLPLWRDAAQDLTPRRYAADFAALKGAYAAIDGRYADAYAVMRDACRWWPENHDLRSNLARYADADARALLREGRTAEARIVALEATALAPEEVRAKAPALIPLASAPAPAGRGTP